MKQQSTPFPKRFLWGAATAAHQVEGSNHNQWTVWELENARSLAAQAGFRDDTSPVWDEVKKQATHPDNYVSGGYVDQYHRYEEDIALLKKLNMNAYRLGIEWSRIQPSEGAWESEAVAHYRTILARLRSEGIEPVVTLMHFTQPVWLSDMGGFEKRRNIKHFVRYVERIMSELGTHVRFIITINEPEVFAVQSYYEGSWPPAKQSPWLAYRVLKNQITAHKRAARVLHGMNRKFRVSIAKNSCYFYPGDDAWLSKVSASVMQYFQDDYILKRVRSSCDFIGLNYYFSNRVYGYRIHNPDKHLNDLGWDMNPGDIQFVLERLTRKYHLPILITENGLADRNDEFRKWWIATTIAAMQRALEHDVKLIGYLHWSLLDNFEWAYGKWPRFGLTEVDTATNDRTLRPSALWFGKIIKKLRGI